MNLTNPFRDCGDPERDEDDDALHEECGVFGVIGARDAASITAQGLHALQHRGQEAVGIVSYDRGEFLIHRGTGHVAQVFANKEVLDGLTGDMASGHVRYATTGGSGLRNVQPLFADLASGGFSIAHNGNISNAMALRRELVTRGAIFQSTSDTEVIIHLVATSRYPTLLDRFVDALRMVEGAYSLICMTREGMIACRDPLGIRPLVMGKLGDAYRVRERDRGVRHRRRRTGALDRAGRAGPGRPPGRDLVAPPVRRNRRRARASSSTSISAAPIR